MPRDLWRWDIDVDEIADLSTVQQAGGHEHVRSAGRAKTLRDFARVLDERRATGCLELAMMDVAVVLPSRSGQCQLIKKGGRLGKATRRCNVEIAPTTARWFDPSEWRHSPSHLLRSVTSPGSAELLGETAPAGRRTSGGLDQPPAAPAGADRPLGDAAASRWLGLKASHVGRVGLLLGAPAVEDEGDQLGGDDGDDDREARLRPRRSR